MFVSRISIQNYRCFRFVELDASLAFNLIVGANNSGKSTLLRTLTALQFGAYFGNEDKRVADGNGRFTIHVGESPPATVSGHAQQRSFDMQANQSLMMTLDNSPHHTTNPPFPNSYPQNFACVFFVETKGGRLQRCLSDEATQRPHFHLNRKSCSKTGFTFDGRQSVTRKIFVNL